MATIEPYWKKIRLVNFFQTNPLGETFVILPLGGTFVIFYCNFWSLFVVFIFSLFISIEMINIYMQVKDCALLATIEPRTHYWNKLEGCTLLAAIEPRPVTFISLFVVFIIFVIMDHFLFQFFIFICGIYFFTFYFNSSSLFVLFIISSKFQVI